MVHRGAISRERKKDKEKDRTKRERSGGGIAEYAKFARTQFRFYDSPAAVHLCTYSYIHPNRQPHHMSEWVCWTTDSENNDHSLATENPRVYTFHFIYLYRRTIYFVALFHRQLPVFDCCELQRFFFHTYVRVIMCASPQTDTITGPKVETSRTNRTRQRHYWFSQNALNQTVAGAGRPITVVARVYIAPFYYLQCLNARKSETHTKIGLIAFWNHFGLECREKYFHVCGNVSTGHFFSLVLLNVGPGCVAMRVWKRESECERAFLLWPACMIQWNRRWLCLIGCDHEQHADRMVKKIKWLRWEPAGSCHEKPSAAQLSTGFRIWAIFELIAVDVKCIHLVSKGYRNRDSCIYFTSYDGQ